MLYGFGVYRCRKDGGDRITAAGVAYDGAFEPWTEHILPFNDLKCAITEDGELVVLDFNARTFDVVPEEKRLIVQYGAGELEDY